MGEETQGPGGYWVLREAPKYIQTAIGAAAFIGRRVRLETHVGEAPGPSEIGATARALQATDVRAQEPVPNTTS